MNSHHVIYKVRHKASAWSGHGKVRDRVVRCLLFNRMKAEALGRRLKPQMFSTVAELMKRFR